MKKSIITDQVSQDLKEACALIESYGYKYVELHNVFGKSIEECDEKEVEEIKRILDKHHLKVTNIATTVFFLCPLYEHYKVSLFNPEFHCIKGDVNTHLYYLENACKIANALDCTNVRVFPFRYPDNPDTIIVGNDKDLEAMVSPLTKAADIAKKYNVTLALENCPYSHCPKGEMTNKLAEMINHPNLKLLWDPANSYRAEKHQVPPQYLTLSLEEECALVHDKIAHIHLKNYHYDPNKPPKPFIHKALMEGDIDFTSLLEKTPIHVAHSLEPEVNYEETLRSMESLQNYANE